MNSVRSLVFSTVTMSLLACSGGGGGGGGGGSVATSMLQASKMSCNGSTCIGGGSLSLHSSKQVNSFDVDSAVQLYDSFNTTMIPALNDIIAKVESAVEQGGAESCSDIEVGFSGQVTVGGTLYNVKTSLSGAIAPAAFTTSSMQIGLAGQVATPSFNFLEADVSCGAGTNGSPLVARVVAQNSTQQLNAWFEKGDSKHIRILMVVKAGGVVIAGWFKTDDGDAFEMVLASAGSFYKAVGKKSLGSIYYSENGGGDSCINSTTGAVASNCASLSGTSSILVTGIPNTLASSDTPWASINNGTTLMTPAY